MPTDPLIFDHYDERGAGTLDDVDLTEIPDALKNSEGGVLTADAPAGGGAAAAQEPPRTQATPESAPGSWLLFVEGEFTPDDPRVFRLFTSDEGPGWESGVPVAQAAAGEGGIFVEFPEVLPERRYGLELQPSQDGRWGGATVFFDCPLWAAASGPDPALRSFCDALVEDLEAQDPGEDAQGLSAADLLAPSSLAPGAPLPEGVAHLLEVHQIQITGAGGLASQGEASAASSLSLDVPGLVLELRALDDAEQPATPFYALTNERGVPFLVSAAQIEAICRREAPAVQLALNHAPASDPFSASAEPAESFTGWYSLVAALLDELQLRSPLRLAAEQSYQVRYDWLVPYFLAPKDRSEGFEANNLVFPFELGGGSWRVQGEDYPVALSAALRPPQPVEPLRVTAYADPATGDRSLRLERTGAEAARTAPSRYLTLPLPHDFRGLLPLLRLEHLLGSVSADARRRRDFDQVARSSWHLRLLRAIFQMAGTVVRDYRHEAQAHVPVLLALDALDRRLDLLEEQTRQELEHARQHGPTKGLLDQLADAELLEWLARSGWLTLRVYGAWVHLILALRLLRGHPASSETLADQALGALERVTPVGQRACVAYVDTSARGAALSSDPLLAAPLHAGGPNLDLYEKALELGGVTTITLVEIGLGRAASRTLEAGAPPQETIGAAELWRGEVRRLDDLVQGMDLALAKTQLVYDLVMLSDRVARGEDLGLADAFEVSESSLGAATSVSAALGRSGLSTSLGVLGGVVSLGKFVISGEDARRGDAGTMIDGLGEMLGIVGTFTGILLPPAGALATVLTLTGAALNLLGMWLQEQPEPPSDAELLRDWTLEQLTRVPDRRGVDLGSLAPLLAISGSVWRDLIAKGYRPLIQELADGTLPLIAWQPPGLGVERLMLWRDEDAEGARPKLTLRLNGVVQQGVSEVCYELLDYDLGQDPPDAKLLVDSEGRAHWTLAAQWTELSDSDFYRYTHTSPESVELPAGLRQRDQSEAAGGGAFQLGVRVYRGASPSPEGLIYSSSPVDMTLEPRLAPSPAPLISSDAKTLEFAVADFPELEEQLPARFEISAFGRRLWIGESEGSVRSGRAQVPLPPLQVRRELLDRARQVWVTISYPPWPLSTSQRTLLSGLRETRTLVEFALTLEGGTYAPGSGSVQVV